MPHSEKMLLSRHSGILYGFLLDRPCASLKNDLICSVHIPQILPLLKNLWGMKYQSTFFKDPITLNRCCVCGPIHKGDRKWNDETTSRCSK